MALRDRLVHSLAIVTPTTDGTNDEYGQPVEADPVVDLVSGVIQPYTARRTGETPSTINAGAELSDHVVFMERRSVSNAAYIRYEPDDGDRYEIVGVRDYNFGRSPHLEIDVRRVKGTALAVGS
ncbi:MAG TPA: hypothetical protein VFR93_02155 [Candidatus Limnocylindrales bacterium]|nr:hypothetical protein [Candidatus Limnocylindrales bacterium]